MMNVELLRPPAVALQPPLVDAAAERLIVDRVRRARAERDERARDDVPRQADDAGRHDAMALVGAGRIARIVATVGKSRLNRSPPFCSARPSV